MFKNVLTATLRNMMRNRLYAAINIGGLAVSLAAAFLIALFVRHELRYEQWLPASENIYRVSQTFRFPGRADDPSDIIVAKIARWLQSDFTGIEAAGRFGQPTTTASLRHGAVEALEPRFYWADPDIFEIFAFPVVAGDLSQALRTPDGVVLTRSLARKYFGVDAPLGETIELDRRLALRVTAVIEDLPSNTHLTIDALGSGLSPDSSLAIYDANPYPQFGQAYAYIKVRDAAVADNIRAGFPAFVDRRTPLPPGAPAKRSSEIFHGSVTPIADIHLSPPAVAAMKPRGDRTTLVGVAGVGLLILLMATINFVNLMTASARTRMVEIGVRKVVGAERRALIWQFIGESLLYTALAAFCAAAIAGVVLPAVNGFLDREIGLSLLRDPLPAAVFALFIFLLGIVGGAYPAFVLSAFAPVRTLKKTGSTLPGSPRLRSGLVIVQFAALVGLGIATAAIYRQLIYLTDDRLRINKEQVLVIPTSCAESFKAEVLKIPGVLNASCAGGFLDKEERGFMQRTPDGREFIFFWGTVDHAFFDVMGIKLLAGQNFFETERAAPNVRDDKRVLINETAVSFFQLGSPAEAIGRPMFGSSGPEVIGVVPDFAMTSLRQKIHPTVYYPGGSARRTFDNLNVRLGGGNVPATVAAIAALWDDQPGAVGPMDRVFLDQYFEALYLDLGRQQRAFEILAALGAGIAALGLFGLSAFIAEQRTKEIGIRKSMGATRADILRLLLWQFTKPILWANLIAWPAAYFVMKRWLEGFAYRIELSPWMFIGASALALAIALATVIGHALMVARARPVTALRYE